jgi:hypothetical protein
MNQGAPTSIGTEKRDSGWFLIWQINNSHDLNSEGTKHQRSFFISSSLPCKWKPTNGTV